MTIYSVSGTAEMTGGAGIDSNDSRATEARDENAEE